MQKWKIISVEILHPPPAVMLHMIFFQQNFWRPEMDYICDILVFISVIQTCKYFSQVFGPLSLFTKMRRLQIFIWINLQIYICMTILKFRLNMHIFLCLLSQIWARIKEKKHCACENWREGACLDTLKPPKYLGEASSQLSQPNSFMHIETNLLQIWMERVRNQE